MPDARLPVQSLPSKVWLLFPSAVLGCSAALFLYGYWLTDLLPIGDEQIEVATIALAVAAALGYFFLLAWAVSGLRTLSGSTRSGIIVVSLPVAAFLLFGGTSNWLSADRYLPLFLPEHHLELTAPDGSSAAGTTLVWFNTSLGDVSYDALTLQGWKRVDDELVLQDPNSNRIEWSGPVGNRVQLVFSSPSANARVILSWDGQAESVIVSKDKTQYSRVFSVPFYASESAILVLGWAALYGLVLALSSLLWRNGTQLRKRIIDVAANGAGPLNVVDLVILGGAAVIAGLLRFINLGALYPAVDEYYHLIAAKQILQGVALGAVYPRGLWIVTLPIAAAFRLFGEQLWTARLVGAVFNVLALIPLYLLTRRVNRPVAALACVLYATSPWITTFGRVAREYAYYPFYFYWIIYAMVEFLAGMPKRFVFFHDWRQLLQPKMVALGAVLAVPPIFGLKIDWLSTFRTILISYLVFGLFLLLRFNWRDRVNWPVLAVLGVAVILVGRSWYLEQSAKLLVLPQVNLLPIEYFLPNPQQQWYLNRVELIAALGFLGAMFAALWLRTKNIVPSFVLALFAAYLTVFAFFSRTFFHTRHLLSTDLWYVIVVAIGLYVLWLSILQLLPGSRKATRIAVAVVLGVCFVNVGQILLPALSTNPDMPISEDYMHDMSRVQAFMLPQVRASDVLVSTVYGQYAIWTGSPGFSDQLHITSQTPVEEILAYASAHESGWIVIDEIRFKLSPLSNRDLAGHDQIEYVGEFGDERVWHWDRTSSQEFAVASLTGVR